MKTLSHLLVCCAAVFAIGLTSCEKNQSVTSIQLTPTVLQLAVGEDAVIEADAGGQPVTWATSDASVATVIAGVVTAMAEGEAVITATAGSAKAQCHVFVVGQGGGTAAFSINKSTFFLEVKATEQLKVIPSTPVTWSSENVKIATVDANGLVTGVNDGRTIIKATASDGKYAQCTVIVLQQGGTYQGEYKLVWEDEFEGTALNMNNWNIEVNASGGGNQEKQYYTDRPENIRVENGCLILEARKEEYGSGNSKRDYTSGRINSKGKKEFAYFKCEARIWLPSGQGTWPAFWMLGNKGSWPTCGEIDIMEHVGSQPTMISHALHTRNANGTKGNNWNSRNYHDGIEGSWHTYAVEVMKDYMFGRDAIRFYVDDEITAITTEASDEHNYEAWPFYYDSDYANKFFVIFNLALGGTWGGSINTDIFPQQMKVDWVRVYQKSLE